MNIIEAVKSGRPMRRPRHRSVWLNSKTDCYCMPADTLADDWEIQEEKVTITREKLEAVLNKRIFTTHGITAVKCEDPGNPIEGILRDIFDDKEKT